MFSFPFVIYWLSETLYQILTLCFWICCWFYLPSYKASALPRRHLCILLSDAHSFWLQSSRLCGDLFSALGMVPFLFFWGLVLARGPPCPPKQKLLAQGDQHCLGTTARRMPPKSLIRVESDWVGFCWAFRQAGGRGTTEKRKRIWGDPAIGLGAIRDYPSFLPANSICFWAIMCPAKTTSSRTAVRSPGPWT